MTPAIGTPICLCKPHTDFVLRAVELQVPLKEAIRAIKMGGRRESPEIQTSTFTTIQVVPLDRTYPTEDMVGIKLVSFSLIFGHHAMRQYTPHSTHTVSLNLLQQISHDPTAICLTQRTFKNIALWTVRAQGRFLFRNLTGTIDSRCNCCKRLARRLLSYSWNVREGAIKCYWLGEDMIHLESDKQLHTLHRSDVEKVAEGDDVFNDEVELTLLQLEAAHFGDFLPPAEKPDDRNPAKRRRRGR